MREGEDRRVRNPSWGKEFTSEYPCAASENTHAAGHVSNNNNNNNEYMGRVCRVVLQLPHTYVYSEHRMNRSVFPCTASTRENTMDRLVVSDILGM